MGGLIEKDVLDENDTTSLNNYLFYTNQLSLPIEHGAKIDEFHAKIFDQHFFLEDAHNYIQWMFPLRESGMDWNSQPMTKHESKFFRTDKDIRKRVLESFKIILDFYGFVLIQKEDGSFDIKRQVKNQFDKCIHNLNTSRHNYLRISRILKFLGICGLEHLKFLFTNVLVLECFKYKTIPNAGSSCIKYWIPCLRRKSDVIILDGFIESLIKETGKEVKLERDGEDGFGWGDIKPESWAAEYFKDELDEKRNVDKYELKKEMETVEKDPFADKRGKERLGDDEEYKKRKMMEYRKRDLERQKEREMMKDEETGTGDAEWENRNFDSDRYKGISSDDFHVNFDQMDITKRRKELEQLEKGLEKEMENELSTPPPLEGGKEETKNEPKSCNKEGETNDVQMGEKKPVENTTDNEKKN